MRLLVACTPDVASMNLRDRLLEEVDWTETDHFQGRPSYTFRDMCMVTTDTLHLYLDHVDQLVGKELGVTVDEVIFLSKHKAASGKPTLTMHPIGNFGPANNGGKDKALVPPSPAFLSGLLRELSRTGQELPFAISYEVTHHGPYLEVPTTYVEIGSDESTWGHQGAAKALASAILNCELSDGPVVIGVGGGHYAPRFTEVTLTKKVNFGHMVAKHVLDTGGDQHVLDSIGMAMKASGTDAAYVHKKSFSRPEARRLKELIEDAGYSVLEGRDLPDLQSES
ncbi:MAG: D-aminoacyl-tRNA deacylase [Methanomassiliicoccales archaeon]|nr:D-aminoacyl-tRNA deacylase [Methanomassiliicoccales archaeon]